MGICRQVVVAMLVRVAGIIGPCCSAESAEEEERLNGDVPGGVRKGEEVGDDFCHDVLSLTLKEYNSKSVRASEIPRFP